jgi:predicted aspartyl protease
MVKIDVEGHQIDFILDTGAAISIMTTPTGRLTKNSITIIGATRNTKKYQFCEPQECIVGGHQVRH